MSKVKVDRREEEVEGADVEDDVREVRVSRDVWLVVLDGAVYITVVPIKISECI